MARIILEDGKYYFDAQDGSDMTECPVWFEKSKANDAHPEGKPWIKLPKDNVTNRTYFSEDKFLAEHNNFELEVEVKTSAPRVLGATGVKQDIIKYLDEETATEYTNLVTTAVEKFKDAKASSRKLKPEEMSIEQLKEYITALENGEKIVAKTGPKSFLDMFTEDEYNRYNEILALSAENKANRPRAERRPLTDEEKAVRAQKRTNKEISKAQALLAALMNVAE
jgi:hypothetical protein